MNTYAREQLTFHTLDLGNQSDEVIVLLHGFPADAQSWIPVANRLVHSGYRVLVPDQRGYSPAARPKSRRSYALSKLVEDASALIIASGAKRAHIVGHDWGGTVAWAFASKYPEQVLSLVVISTPHPKALAKSLRKSRQLFLSWYMLFFQLPYLPEWILTKNQGTILINALVKSGLSRHFAQRYAKNMQEKTLLTSALNWYRAMPVNLMQGSHIGLIKPRTLFVFGSKDSYLSQKAALLTHEQVSGEYEFKLLPNASHWIPEEDSEMLAQIIHEFI